MNDLTLKERNERTVRIGDDDAHPLDSEMVEILREESALLEQAYPDDFQRYLDWFVTFCKKTPCHVRRAYGQGFINQKVLRRNLWVNVSS